MEAGSWVCLAKEWYWKEWSKVESKTMVKRWRWRVVLWRHGRGFVMLRSGVGGGVRWSKGEINRVEVEGRWWGHGRGSVLPGPRRFVPVEIVYRTQLSIVTPGGAACKYTFPAPPTLPPTHPPTSLPTYLPPFLPSLYTQPLSGHPHPPTFANLPFYCTTTT